MSEKDLVVAEKLEQEGLFDFKAFYQFCHSWFRDELYGVDELEYKEKVKDTSREIKFKWMATKDISDYFRNTIEMECLVKDVVDVEVEIDGKKKAMNKGKIEVKFKGAMNVEWSQRGEEFEAVFYRNSLEHVAVFSKTAQ